MTSVGPSPEDQPLRLSVVVPTYQRRAELPRFLEPLLQEPGLHEIVVAVDGSTDGTVQWLQGQAARDPRIHVLDLPNRGAGAARQAGIEAATGDVLLLMDDDVLADRGLVSGHARHHVNGGRRLVLGYAPNEWRHLPPGRRGIALIYRRAYESHCARYVTDPAFVLHGLWGGNLSLPRSDFLAIGIENLDVARGQDDREFGIRCLKARVEGVFDPTLSARHEYSRSLAQFRRDMRLQGRSRKMIHEEHADVLGENLLERPQGAEVADAVGLGLPRPIRRLMPLMARQPLFSLIITVLTGAFGLGVRLGMLSVEVFAARGIGSLEVQRGVLDRP